jgi:hypothetical protein
MLIRSLLGGLTVFAVSTLAAQVPPPQQQIAVAVSAAPDTERATATVLGYSNYHRLTTLREGSGNLICLADDPAVSSWHVACYHKDLEPFMAMGRQLQAAGMTHQAIDSARLAAIKAGSMKMPDGPRALYNLYAPKDSVDAATGQAHNPMALQVVYIPYATEESTGIPTSPGGGLPWLMYPGMPWAHIMIMKEER